MGLKEVLSLETPAHHNGGLFPCWAVISSGGNVLGGGGPGHFLAWGSYRVPPQSPPLHPKWPLMTKLWWGQDSASQVLRTSKAGHTLSSRSSVVPVLAGVKGVLGPRQV